MVYYIDKEAMRNVIREQELQHNLKGLGWVEMAMDKLPTLPAPQWVSVKDRLPEEQKEVLIYLPEYDSVEMASLFTIPSMNLREWAQNEYAYMLDEVSYWMPLPELTEEGHHEY